MRTAQSLRQSPRERRVSENGPLYTFREVTIVRHGATAYNQEGGGVDRIRGWHNVPLSALGREQVRDLAQKLKFSGIDYIVSSDLDRARETAEEIKRVTGADLLLTQKFRPWDLGEYTGQESMAVHPLMAKFAHEKPMKPIPGGESFASFKERVFSGLREFAGQYPQKKMAIVTHHRCERLIHAWIDRGSPANLAIDLNAMFKHGEGTATFDRVRIDMNTLYGLVDSK
jgi:broad specificity phosphatase PhoE